MHIGSFEEITLLEFNEEEEENQQETPQATALGEEEKTLKNVHNHIILMYITLVMAKTSGYYLVIPKMIYISVCLVIREEIGTYSVK